MIIFPGAIIGGAQPSAAAPVTYGTNAYLSRGALTGAADGSVGTISFWFKQTTSALASIFEAGPTTSIFLINNSVFLQASGQVAISMSTSSGGTSRVFLTSSSGYNDSAWHHVIASWNTATGVRQIYVDDVSDVVSNSGSSGNIDYTNAVVRMGSLFDGTRDFAPNALAEFWFDFTTHLDLSVAANRRKFINASGKPVFLGANGEKPTGSSPILYINGPASGYGTNLGTGGNFTQSGSFTDEGTAVQL